MFEKHQSKIYVQTRCNFVHIFLLVLPVWPYGVVLLLLLAFASSLQYLKLCSCRISIVHSPESPFLRRVEGKHKILQWNEEGRPRNWKYLARFFRLLFWVACFHLKMCACAASTCWCPASTLERCVSPIYLRKTANILMCRKKISGSKLEIFAGSQFFWFTLLRGKEMSPSKSVAKSSCYSPLLDSETS